MLSCNWQTTSGQQLLEMIVIMYWNSTVLSNFRLDHQRIVESLEYPWRFFCKRDSLIWGPMVFVSIRTGSKYPGNIYVGFKSHVSTDRPLSVRAKTNTWYRYVSFLYLILGQILGYHHLSSLYRIWRVIWKLGYLDIQNPTPLLKRHNAVVLCIDPSKSWISTIMGHQSNRDVQLEDCQPHVNKALSCDTRCMLTRLWACIVTSNVLVLVETLVRKKTHMYIEEEYKE